MPALEGEVQIVDCDFGVDGDVRNDELGAERLLARWRTCYFRE